MFKNLVKKLQSSFTRTYFSQKKFGVYLQTNALGSDLPEIYLFLTKFELKLVFYKNTRISTLYELQPLYE